MVLLKKELSLRLVSQLHNQQCHAVADSEEALVVRAGRGPGQAAGCMVLGKALPLAVRLLPSSTVLDSPFL